MSESLAPLEVASLGDATDPVAQALWVLDDSRRRTKRTVADVSTATLDWRPSPAGHSIGTLLYHIAATEMEWVCIDLLGGSGFAPAVAPWLAAGVRDADGRLVRIAREGLSEHLRRLDATREFTLATLKGMTPAEFRCLRPSAAHAVSAEWIVHHLAQHEAEHRGQIAALRAAAEQASGSESLG
jgi:uncharacterized damage-inducible protein DinB